MREMARRKAFRQVLELDFQKMANFVREERDKRQEYKENTQMYLPSSFCAGLKEPVPEIRLEGYAFELDFPSFPEISVQVNSPWQNQ